MSLEVAKTVRAKFLCIEKGETGYSAGNKTSKLVLVPVTATCEENKQFFSYTPTGKLELGIVNPNAAARFEVGKEYYVDFTNPEDYQVVEATAESLKLVLTEKDLIALLGKNNEQLKTAIEKQEQAKKDNCPINIEEAVRSVGIESGEALMLVKLIQYLRGEKKLDEIA